MKDDQTSSNLKQLSGAICALQRCSRELEPEVLELSFAKSLFHQLATAEHTCAAMKAAVGRRIARSGAWRQDGYRTPAEWMAAKSGESVGNALSMLQTAENLADLPKTEEAVRSGKLSQVQAKHIASAAAADPKAEDDLLKAAEVEDVKLLKERCDKVKAAAIRDERERYEAIHRSRFFRHWTDRDGAFRLEGKLTPDAGASVLAALEPVKKEMYAQAAKQGRKEPKQALAADALVQIAKTASDAAANPGQAGPRTMVHVRVDHSALLRGYTEPGEVCEIPGIGPIPVATAAALAADSFLAVLVTDGADIKAVSHPGRNIPARLRTALLNRDSTCAVPFCGTRDGLEIDHILGVVEGGQTELNNLCRLCPWHHYLKTFRRFRLRGKPGARTWEGPLSEEARSA